MRLKNLTDIQIIKFKSRSINIINQKFLEIFPCIIVIENLIQEEISFECVKKSRCKKKVNFDLMNSQLLLHM